jgi:hypothetical protein
VPSPLALASLNASANVTLAGAEEPFLFISVNAAPPAMLVAARPRPGLEAPVLAFFTAVVPAPPAALAPNALLAID